MPSSITDPVLDQVIAATRAAARSNAQKTVTVDGSPRVISYSYPSPVDWRDRWIYFVLLDRFNREHSQPAGVWNQRFDFHCVFVNLGIALDVILDDRYAKPRQAA